MASRAVSNLQNLMELQILNTKLVKVSDIGYLVLICLDMILICLDTFAGPKKTHPAALKENRQLFARASPAGAAVEGLSNRWFLVSLASKHPMFGESQKSWTSFLGHGTPLISHGKMMIRWFFGRKKMGVPKNVQTWAATLRCGDLQPAKNTQLGEEWWRLSQLLGQKIWVYHKMMVGIPKSSWLVYFKWSFWWWGNDDTP